MSKEISDDFKGLTYQLLIDKMMDLLHIDEIDIPIDEAKKLLGTNDKLFEFFINADGVRLRRTDVKKEKH